MISNLLPVLIIGAGPTGLTMACELARQGIAFRILDKKPHRTTTSNATWIQTRTLELLNGMGLANRFLQKSNRCNAINVYVDGKSLLKVPFTDLDSSYPFVCMLPQSETEHLLEEYLKDFQHQVERSVELVDIKQHEKKVIATVRYADGKTESITSRWLIACDGANSTVREQCSLRFPGEELEEQFIVADALIDSYMAQDEIHVFFDKGTAFVAFPLGENKYRITANLHLSYQRKLYTEREVIEMAQERAHGAFYVKSVSWISPFWIHGKVIKHMREESIFFAGDAAHIHSPAAGQGMNIGMQDAFNLAWKLALVHNEQAAESLLDSYHAERHPIAKEVVHASDEYTKIALFDQNFLTTLQRFERKFMKDPKRVAKKMGDELTELSIRYLESPVIDYDNVSGRLRDQGMRAPDVLIQPESSLYDYLRHTKHSILIFAGLKLSKNKIAQLITLQTSLQQSCSEYAKVYVISKDPLSEAENNILDASGYLHEHYYVKQSILYIIRPDFYIAYCTKSLDPEQSRHFFKRYT